VQPKIHKAIMRTTIIAAALMSLALAGCAYSGKAPVSFDPPYPEVNANGDPILADFEGRIPCAIEGCQVMKVGLVLYQNRNTKAPTTYWLGLLHVGKGNDRTITQGNWTIRRGVKEYPDAIAYELDSNTPQDLRYYWRVNENILLVLDQNMSPKVGNAAWGYMLSRYAEPYGPRTYQ
jgi:hypothetical protein